MRSAHAGIGGVGAWTHRDPRLHDALGVHGDRPLRHHAPGRSWQAVEEGALERDGTMPVNPGGGLIGGGHPVGATGIRMLVDATARSPAGPGVRQVDGARRAATLNIGGSTATTVSFVVDAVGEPG